MGRGTSELSRLVDERMVLDAVPSQMADLIVDDDLPSEFRQRPSEIYPSVEVWFAVPEAARAAAVAEMTGPLPVKDPRALFPVTDGQTD
jgi:hypothetical protein